jgi:uncharacterized membrane protein YphA (DoxX/SURF4 family)
MKSVNPSAYGTPAPIAWLLTQPMLADATRVALASPFIISGIIKLFDFQGAIAEVEGLKLQPGAFFAAAVILTQLGGSALFLTRRFCWLGAGILSVFTLIATLLAHPFWTFPETERGHQTATFFEHVAIIGGFAAAAILAHQRKTVWPRGG